MSDKIRILIVDDSSFLRNTFAKFLENDKMEVVGMASNGQEAVEKAKLLKPDVITMDIEMPVMNGLQALSIIMHECPTSVIMISTLTLEGADATIEALSFGAMDFIGKKAAFSEVQGMKNEIIDKVYKIGKESLEKRKQNTTLSSISNILNRFAIKNTNLVKETEAPLASKKRAEASKLANLNIKVVCIGISTGGPITLQSVIPRIPKNFPVPILIVQHMPPMFTKSLAERLNSISELVVYEAKDGDKLNPGCVYLAPGGYQMRVNRFGKIVVNNQKPDNEVYEPSYNVLLDSVIQAYGKNTLGVIMTGMGADGTQALLELNKIGGYSIAQDPNTCIAYGMPSSAIKANCIDVIEPLDNIAQSICNIFKLKTI